MNRDRYASGVSDLGINMVAYVDAFQLPAFGLQESAEPFSAHCLQTAISITLSFPEREIACTSTDRHPSTAS